MKKYNIYFKDLSIFFLGELFLVFIFSLLNLFGLNSSITTILILIFNIALFILFGVKHSLRSSKKGFIIGFITGLSLLIILILLNILFFKGDFNMDNMLYYLILILSSTLGGMYGKNKQVNNEAK